MRQTPRIARLLPLLLAAIGLATSPARAQVAGGIPGTPPQMPPRDPAAATQPSTTGNCRVAGQVVASDTGAPIRRASVMLSGRATPRTSQTTSTPTAPTAPTGAAATSRTTASGGAGTIGGMPPGYISKQTETDENGRYEFAALPEGLFSINVMPPAGFSRPTQSRAVTVTEGQPTTVVVRVDRGGVITGRLLDEFGEPFEGARVQALRRESLGRGRLMQTGNFSLTNDLGQYRLYGLTPGDYVVSAVYSRMRMASAMDSEPAPGYATTYYPGTAGPAGARTVGVRAAQETGGVDFAMVKARMGSLLVTVIDVDGNQVAGFNSGASVLLQARGEEVSGGGGGWSTSSRDPGIFVIGNIPPGDYYLSASKLARSDGPPGPRSLQQTQRAYTPVSVNGDEQSISLQLTRGATVSGRVVVEGQAEPPDGGYFGPTDMETVAMARQGGPASGRLMISTRPVRTDAPMFFSGGGGVPVAEDGTFRLTGLMGKLMLTAFSSKLALKSVMRGGEDITTKPIELRGSEEIDDMTITLTSDVGKIEGTVNDRLGRPASSASVVLAFPDEPDKWMPDSPFVRGTRTLSTESADAYQRALQAGMTEPVGSFVPGPGRFNVAQLLPGRYNVVALDAESQMLQPDAQMLEKLRPLATTITVTAGQTANVQLKVAELK